MNEYVYWAERLPNGLDVTCCASARDIREFQFYQDGRWYASKEDALEDFIVIHWAWYGPAPGKV